MRRYTFPRGILSPLEAAILAVLIKEPMAAIKMPKYVGQILKQKSEPAHQTMYVLLQRLRDDGLVSTRKAKPGQIRCNRVTVKGLRKFYKTTDWWSEVANSTLNKGAA